MPAYTPTDKEVRRVLTCLKDLRRRPLDEITTEYNKLYPPSLIFPRKKDARYIKPIIDHLVWTGDITAEVLTFYDEPIPATKFYALSQKGIQLIHSRR